MDGGGYIPVISEIGDIFHEGTRPIGQAAGALFGQETGKDIWNVAEIAAPLAAGYYAAPIIAGGGGTLVGPTGAAAAGTATGAGSAALSASMGWPEFEAMYAAGELGTPLMAGGTAAAGGLSGMANALSGWTSPALMAGTVLGSQYVGSGSAKNLAEQQWAQQVAYQNELYGRQKTDIAEQQSYMDKSIQEAQARATAEWQKTAFPSETAISTAKTAGTAALAQKLMQAKQGFFEESAARGISGGGKMAGGIAGMKSESLRDKAKLLSDITQFGQTPYSAPPIMTAYPSMAVPSAGGTPAMSTYTPFAQQAASTIQGLTGTVGGLSTYAWLKKNYPEMFGGM